MSYRHVSPLLFILFLVSNLAAQAPDSISFQGFLTRLDGTPLDSNNVSMTFKLYKGGSVVWTETQVVDVHDGLYNVYLGAVTPLETLPFDQAIDLGITIDGDPPEMVPRTPLASTAYARALPGLYTFFAKSGSTEGYNVVAGAPGNSVGAGVVSGTIGGGGGTGSSPVPNKVLANWATVSGGASNIASGLVASIGGGAYNEAGNTYATIGGGRSNISQYYGTVSGGTNNNSSGNYSTIGGGGYNDATETYATIGGGYANDASFYATVGGGYFNIGSGSYSTVSGGSGNYARGNYSAVPGGLSNLAAGGFSLAAGQLARANHSGSFVWADSASLSGVAFPSTAVNQFLIRAQGGVGIGTNVPANQLTVNGDADIVGHLGVGTNAPDEQLHVLAPSGSMVMVGGNGTNGPHGIVFDDNTPDAGVQLLWRTGPDRLVLEPTSEGTGSDGIDVFFYDRSQKRFVFSESKNAAANFSGHIVGFDNTAGGGADGIAIRLGASNAGAGNNFVSFFDGDNDAYGRIEGNGSNGVVYETTGGDYAEYLPRIDKGHSMEAGDVVAVRGGRVTKQAGHADRYMVITDRPAVLGNLPNPDREEDYERVAFVGQVPVKVLGAVKTGDFILPSGRSDGTAVARRPAMIRVEELDCIVGVAWESSDDPRLKRVNVEVGLDRSRAARIALENELARLTDALTLQQKRIDELETRLAALTGTR